MAHWDHSSAHWLRKATISLYLYDTHISLSIYVMSMYIVRIHIYTLLILYMIIYDAYAVLYRDTNINVPQYQNGDCPTLERKSEWNETNGLCHQADSIISCSQAIAPARHTIAPAHRKAPSSAFQGPRCLRHQSVAKACKSDFGEREVDSQHCPHRAPITHHNH